VTDSCDLGCGCQHEWMTSAPSSRSFAPLTVDHLGRLSDLAAADHAKFTRTGGRPEYRSRRLVVVLAQGAALHFVHGLTGVKDFAVWTFYAALPGQRFPADKRETHSDFGPSEFGRQLYESGPARSPIEAARWAGWQKYTGRRVDFLMRPLAIRPSASVDEVTECLQRWLEAGSKSAARRKPSPQHLARKAVVLIDPAGHRGRLVWPAVDHEPRADPPPRARA